MKIQSISLAEVPRELENLAEAFEARNFSLAALCLGKAVGALAPSPAPAGMEPVAPEAFRTDWVAEMHKVTRALDEKNFGLVGVCLRKAIAAVHQPPDGVEVVDAKALESAVQDVQRSLASADFSSAADGVRRFRDALQFPVPQPVVGESS